MRWIACLAVGWLVYRHLWSDAGLRVLLVAALAGIVLFCTWRSAVHAYDYGFKIALYPLMALSALLSGCLLDPRGAPQRWWNPQGWKFAPRFARGGWRVVRKPSTPARAFLPVSTGRQKRAGRL